MAPQIFIFVLNSANYLNKNIFFKSGAPGGSIGRSGAPYTEAVSSPQWLRVGFHLWPFVASHSLSLSPVSCLLFSCPVQEIRAQKNIFKKRERERERERKQSLFSLPLCDFVPLSSTAEINSFPADSASLCLL